MAFNTKNGQYRVTIVRQKIISDACNVFNAEYWQILLCYFISGTKCRQFKHNIKLYFYNSCCLYSYTYKHILLLRKCIFACRAFFVQYNTNTILDHKHCNTIHYLYQCINMLCSITNSYNSK